MTAGRGTPWRWGCREEQSYAHGCPLLEYTLCAHGRDYHMGKHGDGKAADSKQGGSKGGGSHEKGGSGRGK
jgi:hypothetical protein